MYKLLLTTLKTMSKCDHTLCSLAGFWVCLMAHFTKNGFCLQKRNSSFIKIAHLEGGHVLKMILQYQLMVEDHRKIAILLLQCVSAYFLFVSVLFRWLVFDIFSLNGHHPEFLL